MEFIDMWEENTLVSLYRSLQIKKHQVVKNRWSTRPVLNSIFPVSRMRRFRVLPMILAFSIAQQSIKKARMPSRAKVLKHPVFTGIIDFWLDKQHP